MMPEATVARYPLSTMRARLERVSRMPNILQIPRLYSLYYILSFIYDDRVIL